MKLHRLNDEQMAFFCPACNTGHWFKVGPVGWDWNGSMSNPTLSPSVLVTCPPNRCHSFVRDGRIEFLDDCTHALKGQTVPLPEWE